jgi:hypothetical protein
VRRDSIFPEGWSLGLWGVSLSLSLSLELGYNAMREASGNVASNKIIRGSRAGVSWVRGGGIGPSGFGGEGGFSETSKERVGGVNRVGTEGEVCTVDSDQGERVRPIGLGRIEWMGSLHLPELWVDLGDCFMREGLLVSTGGVQSSTTRSTSIPRHVDHCLRPRTDW